MTVRYLTVSDNANELIGPLNKLGLHETLYIRVMAKAISIKNQQTEDCNVIVMLDGYDD